MKRAMIALAATVSTLGTGVVAPAYGYDRSSGPREYYDYARVVNVEPLYEIVEVNRPRRECHYERVVHRGYEDDSATPVVVGSLIGGAIGNQIGKGKGRDVATAAGVVIGASIGNDIRKKRRREVSYASRERVCQVVDHYAEDERLVGYRVSYRYRGRTYETRTEEHPGRRIRLHVAVTPILD